MAIKLTKKTVDGLEPREARYDVYDSELPRFAVRVTPDGVKTFSLLYRAGSGRAAPSRRVTLGRYGPLTVEQARQLARETLARVLGGADPARDRSMAKQAPTVEKIGEDFLKDVDSRRKQSTASEYRRLWTKHVVPELGSKRVAEIAVADVARLHRVLGSTPYIANRVVALIGSYFSYAERQGLRPKNSNPAHEVEAYRERSRERFLTPAEVTRLGEALTRAERTGLPPAPSLRLRTKNEEKAKHRPKSADKPIPANPLAVAAIRFLLLTGWREGEALNLKWNDVDLMHNRVTLEDTKSGKSQRAIGAPAKLLLKGLPKRKDSPFVFPGAKPEQPLKDISRLWYAVRHAAGLDDVRLHDLRHSFASVSASTGGSLLVIGKLLGHHETATTARYAHLFDDPIRAAADAAAEQLSAWLAGKGGRLRSTSPVKHGSRTGRGATKRAPKVRDRNLSIVGK